MFICKKIKRRKISVTEMKINKLLYNRLDILQLRKTKCAYWQCVKNAIE